jgi:hypothetical protein
MPYVDARGSQEDNIGLDQGENALSPPNSNCHNSAAGDSLASSMAAAEQRDAASR